MNIRHEYINPREVEEAFCMSIEQSGKYYPKFKIEYVEISQDGEDITYYLKLVKSESEINYD